MAARKKNSGDGPTVWLPSIDEQKQKEKINEKGNNIGGKGERIQYSRRIVFT